MQKVEKSLLSLLPPSRHHSRVSFYVHADAQLLGLACNSCCGQWCEIRDVADNSYNEMVAIASSVKGPVRKHMYGSRTRRRRPKDAGREQLICQACSGAWTR